MLNISRSNVFGKFVHIVIQKRLSKYSLHIIKNNKLETYIMASLLAYSERTSSLWLILFDFLFFLAQTVFLQPASLLIPLPSWQQKDRVVQDVEDKFFMPNKCFQKEKHITRNVFPVILVKDPWILYQLVMPRMEKFTVKDVMPKILELKDMDLDVDQDFCNVVTCKFQIHYLMSD